MKQLLRGGEAAFIFLYEMLIELGSGWLASCLLPEVCWA